MRPGSGRGGTLRPGPVPPAGVLRRSDMKLPIPPSACWGLLAALLITAACLACKDQGRFAADWLGVHPPWDELGKEQRRAEELEERLSTVIQVGESQPLVLNDLIAQR